MNSYKALFYIIFIILLGLFSCTNSTPQLPSNKLVGKDVGSTNLLEINKDLAQKEDSLLEVLALEIDKTFKKDDIGFWYRINAKSKGKRLRIHDVCEITYKLKLTDGKVVLEDTKRITVGKKQVVTGLEEGLKLLCKGDSATFIIPWYLGYGMSGYKKLIPPYTSLIFEIYLKD